jgi:membrane fusion protein (multidrug efflux system)
VKVLGNYRDYFLIESGVQANDKIVLEGLQKVAEGLVIEPVEVNFESQFKD